MTARDDLQQLVEQRAGSRCEYCAMHQSLQGATFHVEHVKPRAAGGDSSIDNLAWSCPGCNLHKSDRTAAEEPETGVMVELFNPRTQQWSEHFAWQGHSIQPLTATGRATVTALDLNHPRRIRIRQAEAMFDLFPPEDS